MILQASPLLRSTLLRKKFLIFYTICVIGLFSAPVWAIRPISSSIALVAGLGPDGFQDGSFTSALFKTPLGLSINPGGTELFVADSENNRIRVVHLDQDNRVTTLCGQSTPGSQNGSLASAHFDHPKSLIYLPGDRLVVNDAGNQLLRLIDMKKGIVTTLGGNKPSGRADGPASQVSMGGIQGLVYLPVADLIFYTQPDQGQLKQLDMRTGMVSVIPTQREGLANPGALCCLHNNIYLADQNLPHIFSFEWKKGVAPELVPVSLTTNTILALASSGDYLYALLADVNAPLQRILPQNQPVTFMTAWGDEIPVPGNNLPSLRNLAYARPTGFVADPMEDRKLYIANSQMNRIVSFRDVYGNEEVNNESRLDDLPIHKPARTFRILLVGDSRSRMIVNYPFDTTFNTRSRSKYPPQVYLSKRLEFELNTLAAIEDQPVNFEVLNLQTSAAQPLFLWPTYRVPESVKQNDIDLVIIMQPPTPRPLFAYTTYFDHPITKEGIPLYPNDMEYMLKPPLQRIPPGEPQHFYDLCVKKKLVTVKGNDLLFDEGVFDDPELRDSLIYFYGKPLDVLDQKLSKIRTSSGQPVKLLICSMHSWIFKPNGEDPKIWEQVTQELHIPFLNMNDEMTAMETSYYPLSEEGGNDHFNMDGHRFFAQLLAHDLIRDKLIPWK